MTGDDSDGNPFTHTVRPDMADQGRAGKSPGKHYNHDMFSASGNFAQFDRNMDFSGAGAVSSGPLDFFYAGAPDSSVSGDAVALLFPTDDQGHERSTWNMPGAFQAGDPMDLDHLPPFTVALDVYFDATTPTMYDDAAGSGAGLGKLSQNSRGQSISGAGVSPGMIEASTGATLLRETRDSVGGNQYNFQMSVPVAEPAQDAYGNYQSQEMPQTFSLQFQGLPGSDIQSFTGSEYDGGLETFSYVNAPDDASKLSAWGRRDQHPAQRLSVLIAGADLLPLTTTTSLTPSVTSLHLTQPSFFSANQFFRSSFDQPPSQVHYSSTDVFNRRRPSIDSQNSGANAPARNPRSLASYFPFMGDRDRKLPRSSATTDWPQQNQQLRHLIRSIFKTGGDQQIAMEEDANMFDNTELPEGFEEEDMLGEMSEGTPLKKAKRARRGLFTRFKTTKPIESEEKKDLNTQEQLAADSSYSELIKQETHSSAASKESTSLHNSAHNSIHGSNPNSLQQMSSENLSQMDATEPDYGALFHGVGKRRNLVGMKNKKSKEGAVKMEPRDFMVKMEPKDDEVASASETPMLSFARSSQDIHSGDSKLAHSGQLSQTSTHSSGVNQEETPSTFTSASKRILGARLLKRKSNARVAESQSDVVEIDLKSLDLPPNTEILSKINPKIRTRGRKEDKAADMEDQSKIYVCGYCSRRFKRQEHLKRHFRSLHTSEKPYECPICQKKFSRTDNLNQHLKVHKQEAEAAAAAAANGSVHTHEEGVAVPGSTNF